ncbi:hypothetical protein D5086_008831 [Populus alba]|uniref:Uncharacterized protein n=1 Tax=Populus alba TaxID=43335 RepID=A0ACC4CGI2_POPAL
MVFANFLGVVLLMELIAGGFRFGADGLSMNYYVFNCPLAEPILRSTVTSALQSDPTLAAALVRMHFHDCWIQHLLIYELSGDGGNHSQEVQCMTYQKEEKMGEGVSRFSSSFCGHHLVYVGAHTLGVARCSSFKTRLSDPVDPTMDSDFSKALAKTCSGGDNAEQPFDVTRNNFDSFYFQALQRKAGVLFSDQTLYNNPKTKAIVNNYAMNQAMFFLDFQRAMVKMSLLDVKEGSKGEIEHSCNLFPAAGSLSSICGRGKVGEAASRASQQQIESREASRNRLFKVIKKAPGISLPWIRKDPTGRWLNALQKVDSTTNIKKQSIRQS